MTGVARLPLSVFCVVEHLHQSMAVADDARDGIFTNAGVTLRIGAPDWTNVAVHQDREWWIAWSKFYFGLDLAYAFSATGDRRYARTWAALVRSCIAQLPPEFGPTDALARRLQNWVYAWAQFAQAPDFDGFDADFEEALVDALRAQSAYLQTHLTRERNHRTLELYTLFILALALPEIDPDGSRLTFAWDALHENLLTDCRDDGVHREHSTHYHMVALRSWIGARENARRFGLPVRHSYEERLARAVEFARAMQRPDGSIPMLSDSDTADYREILRLARDLPGLSEGRTAFSDGGYYVQGSQTTTAAGQKPRHLIFDCGPIGDGGHGHYDALSIDAWAGAPLVVDPGRYTYAEGTPDWRRCFKGTAAHNTVCVDGLDQTVYRSGKPKEPVAAASLIAIDDAPGLSVVGGEVTSPRYDTVHRRYVAFVDGDYWLIVDQLDAPTPHDYDLRFNLGSGAWQRTTVDGLRILTPSLELLLAGPGALVLEEGWVSPQYGIKHPAPIVSFRAQGRTSALYVTALLPRGPAPASTAALEGTADAGRLQVRVANRNPGQIDQVVFSASGSSLDVFDQFHWTRMVRE
jgi:hypothetical protein